MTINLKLLDADNIKKNTRRWSFRFGCLTTITAGCVAAWNLTPETWHPQFSETVKYIVMGIVFLFAILANASHVFSQPSLEDTKPAKPAKTNAGMSTQ